VPIQHARLFEQPDTLRRVNQGYRVDQARTAAKVGKAKTAGAIADGKRLDINSR
jgi:hypothetical protein